MRKAIKRRAAKTLRDEFAMAALTGYSTNPVVMQKAIDGWQGNGGPRPCCVADFLAGLAYEVADSMMAERAKRNRKVKES